MTLRILAFPSALLLALATFAACSDEDCADSKTCDVPAGVGGQGGTGAGNTGGSTTTNGGGGNTGCDNCTGHCKDGTECVACLDHSHCTEPDAAKCDPDTNECVACNPADADAATQCAGVAEGSICDAGTCVECTLGDESACTGQTTCNLLTNECVDIAPGDVGNCEPCSNDLQCPTDHRCISMDFKGSFHGFYCLKEFPPACSRPFQFPLNGKTSISNAAPANYCGIDGDLATCEAVVARINAWVCSGTDGMCGPDGQPEVAVPGAICRDFAGGLAENQCTYECAGVTQCPLDLTSCGDGDTSPPGWCGG